MFQAQRLSFAELSRRLQEYEHTHGFSTIEFYRRFESGELGDAETWLRWAGLYHLYLTSMPVQQAL